MLEIIINMASKKCVFKKKENESDADILMSPCLQINPDIQLKDIPTTGEEYLLKVINERKNYSVVTKANKDFKQFAKNQSRFIYENVRPSAPERLKPTIEWQNIQVADFSDIRMYISKIKFDKTIWPNNLKKIVINPNTAEVWTRFFEENEPTLSCMIGMGNPLLDSGLQVLIDKLKQIKPGDSIDYKTGKWIYAILARVNHPLVSDTTNIVRNLARRCIEIRSHINEHDEDAVAKVAPLNIFICLVGRYFGQKDLAD